ncbi:MAG: SDR family NAD(P)-dependent oxidoreductase, partial [Polyangiales bacterium]
MFHQTGVKLPKGAGTRTPGEVADAVIRAIRDNASEINVAAFEQVAGAYLAGIVPDFVASIARMSDGERISNEMAAAQKHKR